MIKNSVYVGDHMRFHEKIIEKSYSTRKRYANIYDIRTNMNNKDVVIFDYDFKASFENQLVFLFILSQLNINTLCLITDYRIYANSITPKFESDKPKPVFSDGIKMLEMESFVKKYFKNWLIIRRASLYGHNILDSEVYKILKKIKDGYLTIPAKNGVYLPVIHTDDYLAFVEQIVNYRVIQEIFNLATETFDLKYLARNVDVPVYHKNIIFPTTVYMLSNKIGNFFKHEHKLLDYLKISP